MRIAAVDVGSNSTRLLVADMIGGRVSPVVGDLRTTRLGHGIVKGRLSDNAMTNTLETIQDYIRRAEVAGSVEVVLAATSAVRDAGNRDAFVAAVRSNTGKDLMVLSGLEEARLGYLGVAANLNNMRDLLVIDIGGGSTEFTWNGKDRLRYLSVNAGAVRMTEGGYGHGEIRAAIAEALEVVRRDNPSGVVGVGGTVTTLAAMAQELPSYDRDKVHGFRLALKRVDELCSRLNSLVVEERKKLPGLQPERADIIPAGAMILSRILHGIGQGEVLVSEADILHGLVLDVWERKVSQ